jgi:hypothetical protein
VAVAFVAVAGCGGGMGKSAVVVSGAEVYAATMGTSSADVRSTFSFGTGSSTVGSVVTESGPFSWSADQGELTMTVAAAGASGVSALQIIDGNDTFSKVLIKGVPAGASVGLPGGSGWTESTWSGRSPTSVLNLFNMGLFGLMGAASGEASPSSVLGVLGSKATSVDNLGSVVVDGIDTTHYRAVIPLSRLGDGPAAPAAGDRDAARQQLAERRLLGRLGGPAPRASFGCHDPASFCCHGEHR